MGDRAAAMSFAAEQIVLMVDAAGAPSDGLIAVARIGEMARDGLRPALATLPSAALAKVERDAEVARILAVLDAEFARRDGGQGPSEDARWSRAEILARPYALALYFEIRRLDALWLWGRTS